jgi:hypothetical protein
MQKTKIKTKIPPKNLEMAFLRRAQFCHKMLDQIWREAKKLSEKNE